MSLSRKDLSDFLDDLEHDTRKAIFRYFRIKNKSKKIVPFDFNKAQDLVYTLWQRMRARRLPIRIDSLKYRQGGLSTFYDAMLFAMTAFKKGVTTWKISHEDKSVENLFKMSKTIYDHLPPELQATTKYANKYELVFEKDPQKNDGDCGLRSQIQTMSARNVHGLRSFTAHCIHGSEVAFWNEGDTLWTALAAAVPEEPETAVISETTANGMNFYYTKFKRRLETSGIDYSPMAIKRGDTLKQALAYIDRMQPGEWLPIFLPWSLSDDCRKTAPDNFFPTKSEREMAATYGLDNDQLFWRRTKIENDFDGNIDNFNQEYPLTPEEAFLLTGKPRFSVRKLQNLLLALKRACIRPASFFLVDDRTALPEDHKFIMLPASESDRNAEPPLRVYSLPSEKETYVIGSDPSEGVRDPAGAHVIRVRDKAVVAVMDCRVDISLWSKWLVWLAKWYNNAFLAVESNSGGLYAAMYVANHYHNCYQRQAVDEEDPEETPKFGWRTTAVSRPLMIAELNEGLVNNDILIPDEKTVVQMSKFVVNANGKAEAQTGEHDDLVVSLCIAYQMVKLRPYIEPRSEESISALINAYKPISKITGY